MSLYSECVHRIKDEGDTTNERNLKPGLSWVGDTVLFSGVHITHDLVCSNSEVRC